MTLENKLRQAAVIAAVDINLKRIGKSPERCARNIMEVGLSAYPNKLHKKDQEEFHCSLLALCKVGDAQKARALFINSFLNESD
jgi:hypothetical protein